MKGKWKNITDEKPMITSRPWVYRYSVLYTVTNRFVLGVPFYISSSLMCPHTHFRDSKQDTGSRDLPGF